MPKSEDPPPWRVMVTPPAEKVLKKQPEWSQTRFQERLNLLVGGPGSGGSERLTGRRDWRLRVGGFRVLYRVDEANRTIVVTTVSPRGDVYKKP